MYGPYGGHMYGSGWWVWMALMGFFWLLLAGGVIAVTAWVLGRARSEAARPRGESALDIVKRRYANGEIGKEEYEQMRRDLS